MYHPDKAVRIKWSNLEIAFVQLITLMRRIRKISLIDYLYCLHRTHPEKERKLTEGGQETKMKRDGKEDIAEINIQRKQSSSEYRKKLRRKSRLNVWQRVIYTYIFYIGLSKKISFYYMYCFLFPEKIQIGRMDPR